MALLDQTGGAMSDDGLAQAIRLRLEPDTDFFARDDPRWQEDVLELHAALRRELPDAAPPTAIHGEKGTVVDLVVDVVTGGILKRALEAMKLYLDSRPKNRSITVSYTLPDGREGTVTVSATNVDSNDLTTLAARGFPGG
jgi:Effector Associated Constant Component 1